MNGKNFLGCIAAISVAAAGLSVLISERPIVMAAYCDPDVVETQIAEEAVTNEVVNETEAAPTEHYHILGDFKLVEKPTPNKDGLEIRTCVKCFEIEERAYVCQHACNSVSESLESTCSRNGYDVFTCNECGTVVDTKTYDTIPCEYGEWIYDKYATPVEDGKRYKECYMCGNVNYDTYTMEMAGENSIYIPGTGIDHKFAIGSFTQSTVDDNDIVYSTDSWNTDEPFILGHNTGTMRKLPKTKVGQNIYVSINGDIEVYEVVISEKATQNNSWTDIIGDTSGVSVWDSVGEKTLHMYTCYGAVKNSRWLVLAKLVEE